MAEWNEWDQNTDTRRRWNLRSSDTVYFCHEYTSRGGYEASPANQLIANLKITPPVPESRVKYKRSAIQTFADELAPFIDGMETEGACMTWIPPSKAKDHPGYDDRIERVVKKVCRKTGVEPVEVFQNQATRDSLHDHDEKRNPQALADNLVWCDCDLTDFDTIYVVDDVLTTGANYRAIHDKILEQYPDINIVGIVWARAIDKPFDEQMKELFANIPDGNVEVPF